MPTDPAPPVPKYRYRLTHVSPRFRKQLKVGEFILDYEYKGREYTWQFVKFSTGKTTGTFTGVYVGKDK